MLVRQASRQFLRSLVAMPEAFLLTMSMSMPIKARGRRLSPKFQFLLSGARHMAHYNHMTAGQIRALLGSWMQAVDLSPVAVESALDMWVIEGNLRIPIRVYHPTDSADPLPVLVYLHGGGWIVGDLDLYDAQCRHLARQTNAIVVAVDYRLAPESKFPAALHDCLAVYEWVLTNAERLGGDPERVALMGDSAGGNLAAALCRLCNQQDLPLPYRLALLYPILDASMANPSHDEFANGYGLTRDFVSFSVHQYVGHSEDVELPLVSPLLTANSEPLPPSLVATAGFDPLCDDGEMWVEAMMERGIDSELVCYDSMIHGFALYAGVIPEARAALDDWLARLRRLLWQEH